MIRDADRLILISQEQQAQAESLGEIRHALSLTVRRIEALEREVATLKAAWVASITEGAEWQDLGISSA